MRTRYNRHLVQRFAADKALALALGGEPLWRSRLVEELAATVDSSVAQVEADLAHEADPVSALEDAVLGLRALEEVDEAVEPDHAPPA